MTPEQLDELAKGLHHEWESPGLWSRIVREARGGLRVRHAALWAAGLAAAIAVGLYLAPAPRRASGPIPADTPLLTEQAMADVERAEAAYRESIDRLARLAAPRLQSPATPLHRAYAEKLTVLDHAIAEIRKELDRNGFNTHLRVQMAALYRDKQKTLEGVLHD